jgi:hypothetical protein
MSVIAILLSYVITIKYKIPKRPDQNICFYLYLAFFSLLLFIFLTRFFLLVFIFLIRFSLSLSPLSLLGHQSHLPLVGHERYSLSNLSLYGRGGLSLSLFVRLTDVFNLYSIDFFFLGFQSV